MRSEFEFINHIKSRHSLSKVGDDCAVLPKDAETDLLITTDMLVEDVDFRLGWASPRELGHKALAVSLSDIAAMGGTPTVALVSIAIGERLWQTDLLDYFYEGWHALAGRFSVELVGGDISRTSGPLTIDSTVLGVVPAGRAVLRSGAKPGDGIYVSGSLGGAAAGLRQLQNGARVSPELRCRQLEPMPQLELGNYLQIHRLATSMIDVSDGLSSDLRHLCESSKVGAEIDASRLPIDRDVVAQFPPEEALYLALNGGEDFELLFTADVSEMERSGPGGVTLIGRVTRDVGNIVLIDGSSRSSLPSRGFEHFTRS